MEKSQLRKDLNIGTPILHPTSFIAKGAQIIGDVVLKSYASVWYNCVLRADINKIIIGERSNIQDNCTIHLENDLGVQVGDDLVQLIHAIQSTDGVSYVGLQAYSGHLQHVKGYCSRNEQARSVVVPLFDFITSTLEPQGMRNLCSTIRKVNICLGDGVKRIIPGELQVAKKLRYWNEN